MRMQGFWGTAAVFGCAVSLFSLPAFAKGTDDAASGSAPKYDIPTGAPASPLFGARPFTQKMLQFEEFGTRAMPAEESTNSVTLAPPADCTSSPKAPQIDRIINQKLWPTPMREANVYRPNPWAAKIGNCVGYTLKTSAIEGRPPGELYAHQRYTDFTPQRFFVSIQAGARTNTGARDMWQKHQYLKGEFGPGGLYYNTTGYTGSEGTTNGIAPRLHPLMPVQNANSVWTFDGTLPPKLLMARYGEPLLFRHYNGLPIDVAANNGFGHHTITTHEHNGHNPAESDGFAAAYFYPGQYFDYRWPMQLAGYDSINTDAIDPHAAMPEANGTLTKIRGDWRETMSTHWFHDHMLDYTAQNVYKGNAAMMNYYGAVDRGREGSACNYSNPVNVNLCLPSGTAMAWGNRDYCPSSDNLRQRGRLPNGGFCSSGVGV